nr:hypothetical protein [uncultured Prevotella sp.]
MKVLSSANASIFIGHRKYLRWPMKILAFFWSDFSVLKGSNISHADFLMK